MSDHDDIGFDEDGGAETAVKKTSGLAALLPNLLKFVAIGLGLVVFIITISVITHNFLQKSGRPQTSIHQASPFISVRPLYSYYTTIGPIRTSTRDPVPFAVVVEVVIGYDLNDKSVADELTGRLWSLRDFVRGYYRSKLASELLPEHEARIKQEMIELINTQILSTSRIREINFAQFDVIEM